MADYRLVMANLQVKNVPEDLHRKLHGYAKQERRSLRDLVLDVLRKEVARREFRGRLERRSRVEFDRPVATILEEVRAERP